MTSRRDFLKVTGAAGAGLVLGLHLDAKPRPGEAAKATFHPNAFLAIRPDGTAQITVPKVEMGQGVRTALPLALAEELDLDWSRIEVATAQPGPEFKAMNTGGSTSVSTTWDALRRAGAAAREMLKGAAAAQWGVSIAQCRTEKGFVLGPDGKKLGYGALAEAAAKLPVPKDPPLKKPGEYRLLGKRTPRFDGPAIVTGKAVFGLDVRRPGQRFAAVLRCPVPGGQPKSWDEAKATSVRGVKAVLKVPTGIAVVADSTWAAFKGRDALAATATWDEGAARDFSSAALEARSRTALAGPADDARREGDPAKALAAAAKVLEAEYSFPYQAHVTVEPMNATAQVGADGTEMWVGSQSANRAQDRAAAAVGLKAEQLKVNVPLIGGGFGRRLGTDFSTEAAQVAKAAGGAVQVVWDREDDIRHDLHHPATLHRLRAGIDGAGALTAWTHRIAGPAVRRSWTGGQKAPSQASTETNGAYDIPYAIPAIAVDFAEVEAPTPLGWWRGIQIVPNVFARECFFDEVAHALGKDPLRFRLDLLGDRGKVKFGRDEADIRRLKKVLEVAAAKAGWGRKLPAGRGLGLACHAYDGRTYAAEVAEVSVVKGRLKVHKVTCAVDCGLVVNPAGLEAQVEGGIAFGLSALFSQITWEKGRTVQTGYHDFPVLRLGDMPLIETHIIPSAEAPSGMGEPPVPVAIPAVLNAVFAATGKRIRKVPIEGGLI
ncbi:xanthine dehydrogenase family protein molybdopterin-binding subunit [Geothrix fermentans]|uniref:xanthine dehydrogenase family protein molybdopterin-binding subunit n=1 Tax=Geothrix fermentans TaxID=44676 RepID=UPI00040B3595|nr:molybdopterin cofactor-binding domain-containing protein [Geothrix fermentans]